LTAGNFVGNGSGLTSLSIPADFWRKSHFVLYLYRSTQVGGTTTFHINANLLLSEYSRPDVQWRWMLGISSGDNSDFLWGFFCAMYDHRTGAFSSTRLAGNTQISISQNFDAHGHNRCVIDVTTGNPPQYINVNIY
jgi:hypothetical protein